MSRSLSDIVKHERHSLEEYNIIYFSMSANHLAEAVQQFLRLPTYCASFSNLCTQCSKDLVEKQRGR